MITVLIVLHFIICFFITRAIHYSLIKQDKTWYPNPPFTFAYFCGALGLIAAIFIFITESDFFKPKFLK